MSIDPLGEKYNWQTNYAFGSNQVVQSREIEGLEADYDQNDYDNYYNNDYLDHTGESNWQPAGFDGGLGPMDGQLDEVVVSNSYKEVFDKYDQIDKDRDGYGGKDDDRDGYGGKDDTDIDFSITHKQIEYLGFGIVAVGAVLTLTGVGAGIGITLMELGDSVMIANTIEKDGAEFLDGTLTPTEFFTDGALIAFPWSYGETFGKEGLDYFLIETGAFGSSQWIEFMNEIH